METVRNIINTLAGIVWGFPEVFPAMVVLLVGTGLFISIRLRWPQFKYIWHSIQICRGRYDNPAHPGDITHFQALSAALSATVGIGNIAGVATAMHYGGPGALFWMWVTGLLGTSLKYTECTLSLKYRDINPDGSVSGGPMYYIQKGLGLKWLAILFACAAAICSFGTGNSIQAFTVADQFRSDFGMPTWIMGLILATTVGAVIIGGIKRIGRVTSILSPLMAIIYFTGGIVIILLNIEKLPAAFQTIFAGAFTPPGAIGGFAGSVFIQTMIWGVKRGLFSNEAGQGSAPIAHAAARTHEPVREGTVALMEPYIDTIVICSITGLCIVLTGAWTAVVDGQPLNGSPMTAYAFENGLHFLGGYGKYIVTVAVLLFGTSTMITWSYYGDRATQYLLGNKFVMPYRYVYCLFIFWGAVMKLEIVWGFGDIALGLMAIPNLLAILALSKEAKRLQTDYYSRTHTPYW